MKLLFVHDVKAKKYNGRIYARSYGENIWKRYLAVFDHIKVVTRCYDASKEEVEGIDELSCVGVTYDDRIGGFLGPDAFFSKRIRRIIREDIHDVDGVLVRLDSFLGLIAIRECKKIGKPYLVEVVGCAWDSFWNHGVDGKLLAPWLYMMMKRAVKSAPFAIYVTKNFLQKRYPTRGASTNISNVSIPGHDDGILEKRISKIKALKDGTNINLYTVANVGVRYKGMHFVVQALSELKKNGHCNYVYHMVGEGDQSYIKDVAKKGAVLDQIVFHGAVSHEGVMSLLREDADIYIQPSLQEGLPRAVIEAMSQGLPCITSDVAGTPELMESKYMFDRSKHIPDQIVLLLKKMTLDDMMEQARRNFVVAQDYENDVLTRRRTIFLRQFAEYIKGH